MGMMKVYEHIEQAYELMNIIIESGNEPLEQIDETMKKELVIEKVPENLELKQVEHTEEHTTSPSQVKQKQKQMNPQSRYYLKKKDEILQKQKEKYKSEEEKEKKRNYYKQHKDELKAKQKDRYNKLKNKSNTNIYKPEDGNKVID